MDHPITIGGLLITTLGVGAGLTLAGFGALMLAAEGISDAPDTSGGGGISGCAFIVGGMGLLAISIIAWAI